MMLYSTGWYVDRVLCGEMWQQCSAAGAQSDTLLFVLKGIHVIAAVWFSTTLSTLAQHVESKKLAVWTALIIIIIFIGASNML
jgi:hypothetical protein